MKESGGKLPSRHGGRPSREEAGKLRDKILDAATGLFFSQGYGATSVESIAAKAGISKRTFYSRFQDKADIFRAIVERVIERLRSPDASSLFEGKDVEAILQRLASAMLRATLMPESLALSRLIFAEATRFPELAELANTQGMRQKAVMHIAALLKKEIAAGRFKLDDPIFAAEQFLQMVIALPQRRALTLNQPLTDREIDNWSRDTVKLFLHGCRKIS